MLTGAEIVKGFVLREFRGATFKINHPGKWTRRYGPLRSRFFLGKKGPCKLFLPIFGVK